MKGLLKLFDVLFPPRSTQVLLRTITPDDFATLVSPTLQTIEGFQVVSLLPYHQPCVQAAIIEAKFYNNPQAISLLAYVLTDYLTDAAGDSLSETTVCIPVPLSKKRKRERGYNQVEQVLAIAVSSLEDVVLDTATLTRVKDTAPQTTLRKKERLQNMHGAFAATSTNTTDTYIIVDDVTTTGATLLAALQALHQAGVKKLSALSLAH